jgi:hypothetical protein
MGFLKTRSNLLNKSFRVSLFLNVVCVCVWVGGFEVEAVGRNGEVRTKHFSSENRDDQGRKGELRTGEGERSFYNNTQEKIS